MQASLAAGFVDASWDAFFNFKLPCCRLGCFLQLQAAMLQADLRPVTAADSHLL